MTEDQAYELPPPISEWTEQDHRMNRSIEQSYYIELAREVWGRSTARERKRWLRRDPLVYSILKGLAER